MKREPEGDAWRHVALFTTRWALHVASRKRCLDALPYSQHNDQRAAVHSSFFPTRSWWAWKARILLRVPGYHFSPPPLQLRSRCSPTRHRRPQLSYANNWRSAQVDWRQIRPQIDHFVRVHFADRAISWIVPVWNSCYLCGSSLQCALTKWKIFLDEKAWDIFVFCFFFAILVKF